MRVILDAPRLELDPGAQATVVVNVLNTTTTIDGLSARVHGFPAEQVSISPALLPLFPDAHGSFTLEFTVPAGFPAGQHALRVEIASSDPGRPSDFADLELSVGAASALTVELRPKVIRSRRVARFDAHVINTGNVALETGLQALDADRSVTILVRPDAMTLPAGATALVRVEARGPRMLFGSDLDRTFTVEAVGRPSDYVARRSALGSAEAPTIDLNGPGGAGGRHTAAAEPSQGELDQRGQVDAPVASSAVAVLRQRPVFTRGVLTALILPAIVALWAAVFLIGIDRVFASDPLTKTVPASFYASNSTAEGGVGGGSGGSGGTAAVPAGALPKNGQVPAGVAGTISGKVVAGSSGQPVGRLQVEALRRTSDSNLVTISSAATQADGTYNVGGLFPGEYLVRVSAAGFDTSWYPGVPSDAQAVAVRTSASDPTTNINITVTGRPATIRGTVDLGAVLTPVPVTVSARPLTGVSTTPVALTVTGADRTYVLANLPAPATYELSFTAPGYQASTVIEAVTGGQERLEPSVLLSAGNGQISGRVTDGSRALGGVTVTTTVNGQTYTTGTPTTGAVGTFVLPGLPTPNTYLVTFSLAGYGTKTVVVDLGAGQTRSGLDVSIAGGTSTVTGRLIDGGGNGLGGATVTVGGLSSPVSTTTLTAGTVGLFVLSGLPAPGNYTLTFSLPGYAPQSVPVALTGSVAPPEVTVTMTVSVGSISGTVVSAESGGGPLVGATITVSSGSASRTTTSTQASGSVPTGGFLITGLTPGVYSVTATISGFKQQTMLVTVNANGTATAALALNASTG